MLVTLKENKNLTNTLKEFLKTNNYENNFRCNWF